MVQPLPPAYTKSVTNENTRHFTFRSSTPLPFIVIAPFACPAPPSRRAAEAPVSAAASGNDSSSAEEHGV